MFCSNFGVVSLFFFGCLFSLELTNFGYNYNYNQQQRTRCWHDYGLMITHQLLRWKSVHECWQIFHASSSTRCVSVWFFREYNLSVILQSTSPVNGERSPRENGPDKIKKEGPTSPRSDGSSHASSSSMKPKEVYAAFQALLMYCFFKFGAKFGA